jgi:hypothetical protein
LSVDQSQSQREHRKLSQNGYACLGAPASAVPEPSTISLVALVYAAGIGWRKRTTIHS